MMILNDISVEGKRVLLRTDYDVPIKNGKVLDNTRIQASLPTINVLLKRKAKIVTILCHLDRPGGKVVENLQVKPVKEHLLKLLPQNTPLEIRENLRFNSGEKENNLEFAKQLAQNSDIFINDAFAVSHRNHASIVSLPKLLPCAIGLHFEKELIALDKVIHNPKPPVIFIIGGAKIETKLPLIKKLVNKADEILIGGKLAQELEKSYSPPTLKKITVAQLTASGKDITPSSAQNFSKIISQAGTVVWNGPMGVFEETQHNQGTKIIAQAVNASPAFTVIGGGDTETAATQFNTEGKINHISTGGGAMLQYLADSTLPGIEAIKGGKK